MTANNTGTSTVAYFIHVCTHEFSMGFICYTHTQLTNTHTHNPHGLPLPMPFTICISFRAVLRSVSVTGWDSLAHQAATIEWWGDGTFTALIVADGLICA